MNTAGVILLTNGSATSAGVPWPGGTGHFNAVFTGTSVGLEYQAANNTTWLAPPGGLLTSSGGFIFDLPPCLIRAAVTAATGVYASANRIPV